VKYLMMTNDSMEPVDVQVQLPVGGRRRRRRGAKPPLEGGNTESLWENAIDVEFKDGVSLQIVGLSSPTRTVFARITKAIDEESRQNHDQADECSFGQAVELVLDKARHVHGATSDSETSSSSAPLVHSGSELLELGSVWLLGEQQPETVKNTRRGSNRKKTSSWRRLELHERDRVPENWSCLTLRIHCHPTRFSTCWKVDNAIIHQNAELGFAILNKPGGVPSHATVDNGVENALSMFQANLSSRIRGDGDESSYYATLPQRLDIETSGLLVIATKKEFASYMSRMLESKTTRHVDAGHAQPPNESVDRLDTITKKYRCVVGVETKEKQRELRRFQTSNTVLTHYLDVQSSAPKTFLLTPPHDDEDEAATSNTERKRWLKCQLGITKVGEALCVLEQGDSSTEASRKLAGDLWAQAAKPVSFVYAVEVEVELFTGRTHQIRGQLGALGCPIVGDPLYGGGGDITGNGRNINVMSLQCCAIKFPHPEWNAATKRGKGKRLVSSTTQCAFDLEQAWWTSHLERSAPASSKTNK
jgi:23S rRNA-/tRNA-specific pseudouridylate synthase